jgi:hypothetical protein
MRTRDARGLAFTSIGVAVGGALIMLSPKLVPLLPFVVFAFIVLGDRQ